MIKGYQNAALFVIWNNLPSDREMERTHFLIGA